MNRAILRENLAYYAHEAWSGWMTYLFGKSKLNADGTATIPADLVERWSRQMSTAYPALPDAQKKSDRDEADRILMVIDRVRGTARHKS